MMAKPKFLILRGDGINCENETALAFKEAGADPKLVHVNDLMENPGLLEEFQGMAIPGGFSFGDELGSGQVLALKIKHGLSDAFSNFVAHKKPIIGICNGFQVLVKLGLLPFPNEERVMALAQNEKGTFVNKWTKLNVDKNSVCKWTKGLSDQDVEFPTRHGEGRVVFAQGREKEIYEILKTNGQIPFTYEENFNGSHNSIAGVCDPTGLVLGMMPHPEAYIFQATYKKPVKNVFDTGVGQVLFNNIVEYLNG